MCGSEKQLYGMDHMIELILQRHLCAARLYTPSYAITCWLYILLCFTSSPLPPDLQPTHPATKSAPFSAPARALLYSRVHLALSSRPLDVGLVS
jgi:hypothetical protein